MFQQQLERKAREDRRRALALQTGKTEEELRSKETKLAKERATPQPVEEEKAPEPAPEEKAPAKAKKTTSKAKKDEPAKDADEDIFDFEEEDDDLF